MEKSFFFFFFAQKRFFRATSTTDRPLTGHFTRRFYATVVYSIASLIRTRKQNAGMIASNLELHRMATKRDSRVITALTQLKTHLFKYQGHVGAALVLGGCDVDGPHLFTVYPHGSSDALPFATMGSGSLAAMAVFESDFKENMTEEEAKDLVARSIRAGIFNDLGSGSNVDLCVIRKGEVEYLRNHETPNERTYVRSKGYDFPPGSTPLNRRNFMTATSATLPLNETVIISEGAPEDAMVM